MSKVRQLIFRSRSEVSTRSMGKESASEDRRII